ncbi:hypothetical protein [Undibacterium fentianense]|uniref:Uncharacterized protein n=1 Tax=Undibacterium fentianense TaxID=2828728 RepID=A0A941E137_9BURK|nr:hypothetical protein [Undibacterium fentianense]MBR7799327.1 hypothetical protein [Undibacterium fentianense]
MNSILKSSRARLTLVILFFCTIASAFFKFDEGSQFDAAVLGFGKSKAAIDVEGAKAFKEVLSGEANIGWGASPFSQGTGNFRRTEVDDEFEVSAAIKRLDDAENRKAALEEKWLPEKMERLKYRIPAELLTKSDEDLWKLAQSKNPYAMNMIAERLDSPKTMNDEERKNFEELRLNLKATLNQGHIRSASTLGAMALRNGEKSEAMIWFYVADSLGDTFAKQYFEHAEFFLEANEAERLLARQKAAERLDEIRRGARM